MNLDNSGIRATGALSTWRQAWSRRILWFYPDSVIEKASRRDQGKTIWQRLFPQVTLTEFKMKWLPKQTFKLKNLRDPFFALQSNRTLDGTLTVSKEGVAGSGSSLPAGSEVAFEAVWSLPLRILEPGTRRSR